MYYEEKRTTLSLSSLYLIFLFCTGSTKSIHKNEDEVLNQILGNDTKEIFSSGVEASNSMVPGSQGESSSGACSNAQEVVIQRERSSSIGRSDGSSSEMGNTTPEELRQQAMDEKKKYKVLKGEGKSDEALRAFKRGKELERQADTLEKYLRKCHKKVLLSTKLEEVKSEEGAHESRRGNKSIGLHQEKDDLTAELRELGWSDADLHSEQKRGVNITLEGELSSILVEVSGNTNKDGGSGAIDKTQVVAHKKKALALKREGKLVEAKEELKRAKVLEKQLEEQELLAESEESDDELSALIRSMDNNKEDFSIQYGKDHDFDFSQLIGVASDHIIDSNFEVTDEDMEDPDIAANLKSLGWTEDLGGTGDSVPQSFPVNKEVLSSEILSLKREALNQKRAGNVAEAMAQLKKAKLLERDLENFDSQEGKIAEHPSIQTGSTSQAADGSSLPFMLDDGNTNEMKDMDSIPAPKSKSFIQKELLGLKKKALSLRREGRMSEAEEELRKGKVLEHQLEEMESISKLKAQPMIVDSKDVNLPSEFLNFSSNPIEDEVGQDVTDQDMQDPAYLSLLASLGWNENDEEVTKFSSKPHKARENTMMHGNNSAATQALSTGASSTSKAEIQRELLGMKRKALALRRQGETEEADKVLKIAQGLEAQVADMEASKRVHSDLGKHKKNVVNFPLENEDEEDDAMDVTVKDTQDPELLSVLKNLGWKDENQDHGVILDKSEQITASSVHSTSPSVRKITVAAKRSRGEIQRELLDLKRKALALRRKGETEDAEEALRMARALEAEIEELEAPKQVHLQDDLNNQKTFSYGSLMNQEIHETSDNDAEHTMVTKSSVKGADNALLRTSTSSPKRSHLTGADQPVVMDLGSSGETRHFDSTGTFEKTSVPQSSESVNMVDFLTGDDWRGSEIPTERKTSQLNPYSDASAPASPNQLQRTSRKDVAPEDSIVKNDGNMVLTDGKLSVHEVNSSDRHSQNKESSLRQDVLARKKKAIALKREGRLAEAREELRHAKLLEKQLEEDIPQLEASTGNVPGSTPNIHTVGKREEHASSNIVPKPLSSRDRFKLQQESLGHKRQALKLRREGRIKEAEAEFELAKALESQLEDMSATNTTVEPKGDVVVDDFLDPQLLSALRAIGIEEASSLSRDTERSQPSKPGVQPEKSNHGRSELEEQIKAEKVKALNLKRSGKQAEALEALRRAKVFERKLNSLDLQ